MTDDGNERWTQHIDFTTTDGNFKTDLEAFKNYIRECEPLTDYASVQGFEPKSMVARFKAWLWNKGVYTIGLRNKD